MVDWSDKPNQVGDERGQEALRRVGLATGGFTDFSGRREVTDALLALVRPTTRVSRGCAVDS
jgi:hypothetical protein